MSNLIHNTDHEPIYNQDDMDAILDQLQKAQKENELTHQLLWAVVQVAGGEVAVPHRTWIEGDATRQVIMWDDEANYVLRLKIVEPQNGGV